MATVNTKTIKASLGDYTSLANWEAGRQGNLVSLDTIEIAECYYLGTNDVAVVLNGWTTGPNNYIKIYTPTSERHTGSWDTTKYYIIPAGGASPIVVNPGAGHIIFDGLQMWKNSSSGGDGGISFQMAGVSSSLSASVSNCLIRGILAFNNYWGGVHVWSSVVTTGSLSVFNNFMFDFAGGVYNSGILTEAPLLISMSAYNNTMWRCQDGIRLKDGWIWCKAINNLISTSSVAPLLGTFANGTDYNATDSASLAGPAASYTVTGGGNTHERTSQKFSFKNTASFDFHLLSSDTGAKGYGNDLRAFFTTDIDGVVRGPVWDIGGDQVTVPGYGYFTYYDVARNAFVTPSYTEAHTESELTVSGSLFIKGEYVEDYTLDRKFYFRKDNSMVSREFIEE